MISEWQHRGDAHARSVPTPSRRGEFFRTGPTSHPPGTEDAEQQILRWAKDPVGCLAALNERFGLRFTPELAAAVGGFVAERPNGGYGRIHRRLAEYGLDAPLERRRYRDYIATFGV
jgi:hypothetical protein